MNTVHAFHALRELADAGAVESTDRITVFEALASLGEAAGLSDEARLAKAIADGLRGAETMELKFRELEKPVEGGQA